MFTVELGPDINLPFVEWNKGTCVFNPYHGIYAITSMFFIICNVSVSEINFYLTVLVKLLLHLRVNNASFFLQQDASHFLNFVADTFFHLILTNYFSTKWYDLS